MGAYSTALVEGLAFGLDTCVVTLPGRRELAFLYERGLAHRVDDVDALLAVLEAPAQAPASARLASEALWAPNPRQRFAELLVHTLC